MPFDEDFAPSSSSSSSDDDDDDDVDSESSSSPLTRFEEDIARRPEKVVHHYKPQFQTFVGYWPRFKSHIRVFQLCHTYCSNYMYYLNYFMALEEVMGISSTIEKLIKCLEQHFWHAIKEARRTSDYCTWSSSLSIISIQDSLQKSTFMFSAYTLREFLRSSGRWVDIIYG